MDDGAQPIMDIRVSDGRVGRAAAPFFLHFAQQDLDARTAGPLGYIVENRVTREALHARAEALPALKLLAPASIAEMNRDPGAVAVRLEDGRALRAQLVIAADGRRSAQRQAAGIEITEWDYPQDAIVATIHHDKPHHGVAFEHFLPAGPFALLPMTDTPEGQPRSSLVWAEKRALVPTMMALSDADFSAELMRRFGGGLGFLREVGGRWSYPLSLLFAERIVDHRLALVGDAAHGIHPISGQGLNLGLRDVAALAEILVDARRLGLDLGGAEVLAAYPRWRRFDNLALMAVTDSLNRLFSNDIGPIRLARDLGLAAVDRMPPLKSFFMRHAMGLVGDLPKLVRGETL
jgi:2-octaprenyl-6-methoxyphenol hydroxylase